MKNKIFRNTLSFIFAALAYFPAYADETQTETRQQVTAYDLSNILLSFLYLAVVLALIYVVLIFIERYAKKNRQNQDHKNNKLLNCADNKEKAENQNEESQIDEDIKYHE